MSNIFGVDTAKKIPKVQLEDSITQILTCENSRSFFCTNEKGKFIITNESVKTFVLDKLYTIISQKISKLDADYQEILKSKGDYLKYKHFATIDATVKELSNLLKEQPDKVSGQSKWQLESIFTAHDNIVKNVKHFKDAFAYDVVAIKQYYLVVVASIIYATGFIVSTMLDYERRNTTVPYEIIFKNVNILERGLPKNMMTTIETFNNDVRRNALFKTVTAIKNKKPAAAVRRESKEIITEEMAISAILTIGAVAVSLIVLIPLIRHAIYFFMHTKLRLSEYFDQQAAFLELNIKALKAKNVDQKIIDKQTKAVEKLHDFAAKLSGDVYTTEKIVENEIASEDRSVVAEADKKAQKDAEDDTPDFSDSDILL